MAVHSSGLIKLDDNTWLELSGTDLILTRVNGEQITVDLSSLAVDTNSISALTNTILGNRIGTHNDGEGVLVDINETITGISLVGTDLVYMKEDGTTDSIPVPGILGSSYEERWDSITPLVSGAWHVVTLPGPAYPDRLVDISFFLTTGINNITVGAREVGSTLNRSMRIDRDSTVKLSTKTNNLGQIEIFVSNINANAFVSNYN